MFNFFQLGKNATAPKSAESVFAGPLSLSPTGAYATHRLSGIQSTYILRARRVVAADIVDIYDFQNGTNNYKLTSGGGWIDGSSETFYLHTLYDQSGNSRNFSQSTEANQPEILLNSRNGYPTFDFNGTSHTIRTTATADDFIDNNLGVLVVSFKPTGATPGSVGLAYAGHNILFDADGYFGITRTNLSGVDRIWANNFSGADNNVGMTYSVDTWINVTWRHVGGNLYAYKNGSSEGFTSSGNTDSVAAVMQSAKNDYSSVYFSGETNQYYLFGADLTSTQISQLSTYIGIT